MGYMFVIITRAPRLAELLIVGMVLVSAWTFLMREELGAADLFIETSRSTFDPIPVAVFPFQTDDWAQSLGFSPTAVLEADLKRSQWR